jgi:hypothetical protein
MLPLTGALVPHSWKKLLVLGCKNQQHRRWTMHDGRWTMQSGSISRTDHVVRFFRVNGSAVLSSPYILKSQYKFFTADNEQKQQITNEWMISCPPFLTSSSYQHGCEQNPSYGAGVCVFESIVSCPHEHVAAPHQIVFQWNNPYILIMHIHHVSVTASPSLPSINLHVNCKCNDFDAVR